MSKAIVFYWEAADYHGREHRTWTDFDTLRDAELFAESLAPWREPEIEVN